jgi:ribosomal protein S18 acetylase RimI-like enzyme
LTQRIIRHLGCGDEEALREAEYLFDGVVIIDAASRFLNAAGHHMLVAYEGAIPVGFVSGVETIHPDKGTELFLYELAVAEEFRRRGHGKALVKALAALGRDIGCYGMWVATDRENIAALATYRAAGKTTEESSLILAWTFESAGVPAD